MPISPVANSSNTFVARFNGAVKQLGAIVNRAQRSLQLPGSTVAPMLERQNQSVNSLLKQATLQRDTLTISPSAEELLSALYS